MRFVFPSSMIIPKAPDEMFQEQVTAFRRAGFATSLFPLDSLSSGPTTFKPALVSGEIIIYRGWMLSETEYASFERAVQATGASLLTPLGTYLATHHLPRWYPFIKQLTPETVVYPSDINLVAELKRLGWGRFFIKDYVKSLKTSVGSLIDNPETASVVASEMVKFRGTIEGGFCARKVETFITGTETRFFVINGKPYAPEDNVSIPQILSEVTSRIQSPFFSVDIAERSDGQLRVAEVGDGQVSDIVGWTPERLALIWKGAGQE